MTAFSLFLIIMFGWFKNRGKNVCEEKKTRRYKQTRRAGAIKYGFRITVIRFSGLSGQFICIAGYIGGYETITLMKFASCVFLLLFCVSIITANSQVLFSAKMDNDPKLGAASIVLNGKLEKGWRIYVSGDTALQPEPLTISWTDAAIGKSGTATISNSHFIKDPLFAGKSLKVVDHDFILQQPVTIQAGSPSAVIIKIKGFAASKDNFIPIDTMLQLATGIVSSEAQSNENNLKLANVHLDKPFSDCGQSSAAAKNDMSSGWIIFLKGFAGGLLAILMPCIFPMIPVTIAVFTGKSNGIKNSIFYGISIVFIYTLASLPFHLVSGLNPQILNEVSTNATVNLVFFFIFVAFALSLFGVFEIRLPAAFGNKAGNKSHTSSLPGIFFMALTLCIISFSCTGPILGFHLASSIDNGAWPLTTGMFGFGLALALPFTLFALFPAGCKKFQRAATG